MSTRPLSRRYLISFAVFFFGTNRASSECNTSGSCRYDNEVKSFCPIRMVGLRSNGQSFSCFTSITFAMPLSVHICICLSPGVTSAAIVAPSQTLSACGIHIRAPYIIPPSRPRPIKQKWIKIELISRRLSKPQMNFIFLIHAFALCRHTHILTMSNRVSHFKCLFVVPHTHSKFVQIVMYAWENGDIWSNDCEWNEC